MGKESSHMAKKLMTGLLALVALAALALPAVASASPELGETTAGGIWDKTPVHNPAKTCTEETAGCIQATSLETSKMTSPGGSTLTECSTAFMTGWVYVNSGTSIEGNITSAAFSNAGGADCTALFGGTAKVTTTVGNGVPWCIRTTKNADEVEIRGGLCSAAPRSITFVLDTSSFGECSYNSTVFPTGTFTTHSTGDAIVTLTKKGLFTKEAGSAFCPHEANLDMKFTLETDGTNTPLYIR
jgi:hypothetical protein